MLPEIHTSSAYVNMNYVPKQMQYRFAVIYATLSSIRYGPIPLPYGQTVVVVIKPTKKDIDIFAKHDSHKKLPSFELTTASTMYSAQIWQFITPCEVEFKII